MQVLRWKSEAVYSSNVHVAFSRGMFRVIDNSSFRIYRNNLSTNIGFFLFFSGFHNITFDEFV